MMKINKLWLYYTLLALCLSACSISKNVPEGYFLLKSNRIEYVQKVKFAYDLEDILKQRPNQRTFGMLLKLRTYNLIDSAKIVKKKKKHFDKFQKKENSESDNFYNLRLFSNFEDLEKVLKSKTFDTFQKNKKTQRNSS